MNGNPRVGYVVKRYPRYSETFIVNELLAHEAAGLDVEIFALRPPVDTHFQDLIARVRAPVHYLPHAGLKARELWEALAIARKELPDFEHGMKIAWRADVVDVFQAATLAREVRDRGIEHLHAHFASSPTSVTEIAARMAGIPFSFTAHAKDIYHEDVKPERLRQKQRNAAAVITVSDFNVRHLRESDAASADRVVRIYNGLDLETFNYQAPRNRPKRIVAVGRLVEKKGFGVLLDACAVLAEGGQDFECRIIGAGPLEGDLRRRIDELGLGAKVALEGPLPQCRIRQEVQAAAVFAAPCVIGADGNRDGLPTTLLEAMALGTPCISTDVTGIPEIVRDEETGLLVPQHDPKALARAAARLLEDPDTRDRLATGARRLIENEFDVTYNTARQREIFGSAARGAAGLRDRAGGGGMMRIAYVCADPGVPVFGSKGCSIHVQEVVRALGRRGFDVDLHAARVGGPPPPGLANVPILRLPRHRGDDPHQRELAAIDANAALARSLESRAAYDLVYERHSLWSTAGMEFARAAGVPGILEVNAPLVEEQATHRRLVQRELAEAAVERACKDASLLIAVSNGVAAHLRRFDAVRERVHVVPNGVDPQRFPPRSAPRSEAFTVGFIGSLKPWHGLPILVEAFARLHRRLPECRLLVVGEGPERKRLEEAFNGSGLSSVVRLTGAVSPAEVPAWLEWMDVGVAPYAEDEGFYFSPLKIFEYMAAGLPVVASGIGQIPEFVEDGHHGLLCAPGDPEQLAAALDRLAADPTLRIRMGCRARQAVLQRHTWDAVVGSILELADATRSRRPHLRTG